MQSVTTPSTRPHIVNVAIVAFNRPASLVSLVNSLLAQTYPVQKIFVIDNSSNDEVRKALADSGAAIEYQKTTENIGSAGGFSLAIESAHPSSDYVWIFDDDMNIQNDALLQLMGAVPDLDHHEDLGVVRCCARGNKENVPRVIESFAWRGTCIKSSVIARIGPPDAKFFMYAEDVDYALRIKGAGYRMYCVPASLMWINSPPTKNRIDRGFLKVEFHAAPFRLYYGIRNEIILHSKYKNFIGVAKVLGYGLKVCIGIACAYSGSKYPLVRAVFWGVVHGVLGRTGKNNYYIPISTSNA